MPCRIVKLMVHDGQQVAVNVPLLTVESMKMEVKIVSHADGTVKYHVKEDQVVDAGTVMLSVVVAGNDKVNK